MIKVREYDDVSSKSKYCSLTFKQNPSMISRNVPGCPSMIKKTPIALQMMIDLKLEEADCIQCVLGVKRLLSSPHICFYCVFTGGDEVRAYMWNRICMFEIRSKAPAIMNAFRHAPCCGPNKEI